MKDYIQVINKSHRSDKRSPTVRLFLFLKKISKFLSAIALLLFLLLLVLTSVWLFFPTIIFDQSPKSFIFIFNKSSSEINKIYYAYFNADANEMELYLIDDDYSFRWLNMNDLSITEGTITEYFSLSKDTAKLLKEANSSWMVGRLVDEVIYFEVEEGQLDKYGGEIDVYFIRDVVKKRMAEKISLASFRQSIQNWALMFFSEWNDLKIYSRTQSFPGVYSSDCSVVIINATDISGYAQEVSSIIEKSGLRVVRVDSLAEKRSNNAVAISNKSGCQDLARDISSRLLNQYKILNLDESNDFISRYRADIILILGVSD